MRCCRSLQFAGPVYTLLGPRPLGSTGRLPDLVYRCVVLIYLCWLCLWCSWPCRYLKLPELVPVVSSVRVPLLLLNLVTLLNLESDSRVNVGDVLCIDWGTDVTPSWLCISSTSCLACLVTLPIPIFKLRSFRQLLVLLNGARLMCRAPLMSTSLCLLCVDSLLMWYGITLRLVSSVVVSS